MDNRHALMKKHLLKKPGEKLEVLWARLETICEFHEDPLSAALMATSYYGMEELKMRLPRLNDMLRNPFAEEEILHAITGLIMVADGGPAEGAKVIQIYMSLMGKGMESMDVKTAHRMAMLAISCKQVREVMDQIYQKMDLENGFSKDEFHDISKEWLLKEQKEKESMPDDSDIAYAFLVGMKDEVETLFDEEL